MISGRTTPSPVFLLFLIVLLYEFSNKLTKFYMQNYWDFDWDISNLYKNLGKGAGKNFTAELM